MPEYKNPKPTVDIIIELEGDRLVLIRRKNPPVGWALPASFAADPAPLKFLVNPNSPTGTWYRREEVEAVVVGAKGVIVLDEAYVDFAPESRLDLLADRDNLLILRTMSKSYALAGMRIGFAFGHPDLLAALDTVKDSYNLDRLAIVAAKAAAEDRSHRDRLVSRVVRRRAAGARLPGLTLLGQLHLHAAA